LILDYSRKYFNTHVFLIIKPRPSEENAKSLKPILMGSRLLVKTASRAKPV
jgi:hypothetical protein